MVHPLVLVSIKTPSVPFNHFYTKDKKKKKKKRLLPSVTPSPSTSHYRLGELVPLRPEGQVTRKVRWYVIN